LAISQFGKQKKSLGAKSTKRGGREPVECCAWSRISLWRTLSLLGHCDATSTNPTSIFWVVSDEVNLFDVSKHANQVYN
jgi:hypothetical protein